MSNILPYFEDLDLTDLEDYYEAEMPFGNDEIDLDLNFEATEIEEDKLVKVKTFLDEIKAVVKVAEQGIRDDFATGTDVKEFIAFHIDEVEKHELDKLVMKADKKLSIEEQLLSVLKIRRIGFYPEEDEIFAILDFTLDEDLSDYLLVVNMNSKREVEYITMES